MKTFTIASIVALASVASAQLDNIPQCALSCFVGPLTSDGCANLTDFSCHCKKGEELLSKVQPCVQGACSAADQQKAISAVESTCKAAGVPITIPGSGAASSAAPSSAAAPASSAAAPSSSQAAASSVASSAASAVSSVASVASSVLSSIKESVTAVPTPSTATSASASASVEPSSASEFTGAAAQATQAVGIIGAAALALLAL